MTKHELQDLAIKLDYESGFPALTAEQSWHARAILGPVKFSMHEAANDLWAAAGAMDRNGE